MAVTLHTNSGFVTVAPTADPAGSADVVTDGSALVTKDTAPAGAVKITEVGWYKSVGTTSSNTQVGLYAADGATVPGEAGTRLQVTGDAASGTSAGWIRFTGLDWPITAGTVYWLGMQQDAHAGSSDIDSATSGGSGIDVRTSQTALPNPFGGGALADVDGMYAIYAVYQTAPTTALNTPADAATGVSTTPTLNFTGTDAESDAVEYEVQVDTVNTFNSINNGTGVQDTSNLTNNSDTYVNGGTTGSGEFNQAQGQGFTPTLTGPVPYIDVSLAKENSPTDNVYLELLSTSISGTVQATSGNVAGSGLTTTKTYTRFTFASPYTVTSGTTYYWRLRRTPDTYDATNRYIVGQDNTNSYAGGTMYYRDNNAWNALAANDLAFKVFVDAHPVIDALSASDAGFTAGHPFASGAAKDYTVQSALSNSTVYYWRVRAIDPTGSNEWGAWATTRSFTTAAAGGGGTVATGFMTTNTRFWGT